MNKLAASAASLDYVKFQAVIKSAASAASPKTKSRKPTKVLLNHWWKCKVNPATAASDEESHHED